MSDKQLELYHGMSAATMVEAERDQKRAKGSGKRARGSGKRGSLKRAGNES